MKEPKKKKSSLSS